MQSVKKAACTVVAVACSLPLSSMTALAHSPMQSFAPPVHTQSAQPIHAQLTAPTATHASFTKTLLPSTHLIPLQHATSSVATSGANLNLTSTQLNFLAGNLANFGSLTIDVGGRQETVGLNTRLTAAELVAVDQRLAGVVGDVPGAQGIVIGANGAATGGAINLNNSLLNTLDHSVGSIASITVAHNVTVVDSLNSFDLSGKLVNYGSIQTASAAAGNTDTLAASSIVNAAGGAISSYISSGNSFVGADVALAALSSLTNAGSIRSAGNLTVSALSINNTGALAAGSGNVNLTSPIALNLSGAGSITANHGNINFTTTNANITASGANLYSQQVNFVAGIGNVSGSLGTVTGVVNSAGNSINVGAATPALMLGSVQAAADPLFFNSQGDVIIGTAANGLPGTVVTATSGAPLSIVASGNILSESGSVLNTSSSTATGNGGNLTLVAGAQFAMPLAGQPLKVTGGNAVGGLIDLGGGNFGTIMDKNAGAVSTISTSGGSASGNAGTITMVAYQGTGSGSGQIISPTAMTATAANGTGGSITVIAGGTTASLGSIVRAINISGALDTHSGSGAGGAINLSNSNPSGSVSFDNSSNTALAGTATGVFKAGALVADGAGVSTNAITTGGGNLNIATTGPATLGVNSGITATDATSLTNAFPGSAGLAAGNISVSAIQIFTAGTISAVGAGGAAGDNGIATSLNGQAGGTGGAGGVITLAATNILASDAQVISEGGAGGVGGGGFGAVQASSGKTGAGGAGGSGGASGAITLTTTNSPTAMSIDVVGNVISLAGNGGVGGDGGSSTSTTTTAARRRWSQRQRRQSGKYHDRCRRYRINSGLGKIYSEGGDSGNNGLRKNVSAGNGGNGSGPAGAVAPAVLVAVVVLAVH